MQGALPVPLGTTPQTQSVADLWMVRNPRNMSEFRCRRWAIHVAERNVPQPACRCACGCRGRS
jgi:hypothetical protein